MNAGPYSDEKVQSFLSEHFITIKSQCFWNKQTELMKQFNIKWTPTLFVLDKRGIKHHRVLGYVPVDDLLAHLWLGRGKVFFDADNFTLAIDSFRTIIERHPDAGVSPEAVYLLGVAEYKKNHDSSALRRAYDTLRERYPQSEWFRRAEPYSTIPAFAELHQI